MNKTIPQLLYHGTVTGGIKEFEPQKRYTPGTGKDVPPRIYATDRPDFAAMHSFPWSSEEGIDIDEREGKLCLKVPKDLETRLNQPVYIYTLKSDAFTLTEEEEMGKTYHAEVPVQSENVEHFASVTEAIEHYGGLVELV